MPPSYTYSPLENHDEKAYHDSRKHGIVRRLWPGWYAFSLCLLSNVLACGLGFLLASQQSIMPSSTDSSEHTAPSAALLSPTVITSASTSIMIDGVEVKGTQCGNSWQEAKALGCRFDVMASRWYSPECFDQEVLDEMLAEPHVNWNFTWYEDKAHTVVVPPEKVFKGEFDRVYPNNLFHIKHCLHLWRKLHHAVLVGASVDEDILSYEHTRHCTNMIMEWTDPSFKRHSVTHAESATPFCRSNPVGLLDVRKR